MLCQMGQGKLQEMPVKITKTVVDTAVRSTGDVISKLLSFSFNSQYVILT